MSDDLNKKSARSFFRSSIRLDRRLTVYLAFVTTGIAFFFADHPWWAVFLVVVPHILWFWWSFSDWKAVQENDASLGSFIRELYNDGPRIDAVPDKPVMSERDQEIEAFIHLYSAEENGPEEEMPKNVSPYNVSHFVRHNLDYVGELLSLPRYEEVRDLPAIPDLKDKPLIKSEFCVALGRVFLWRGKDKKSIHANVYIPKNPYVAYNGGYRKKLEKILRKDRNVHPAKEEIADFLNNPERSHVGPFLARVAAGGAITILKFRREDKKDFDTYIAVGQKDCDAGLDKFKLIPQSGISEHHGDYKDWTDPRRLVAGECVEEIRIVDEGDSLWYRPFFDASNGEKELDARVYVTIITRFEALRKYREEYCKDDANAEEFKGRPKEWMKNGFKPVPAKIEKLGNGSIKVHYDGEVPAAICERKGFLAIDAEVAVVDLMEAVIIELPKSLSELRICDGEILNGDLLWRNLFLFTPDQFLQLIIGRESEAKFFGDVCNWPSPGAMSWRANVKAYLSREPWMAVPLKKAAERLFEVAASSERLRKAFFGDDFKLSGEQIDAFKGDGEQLETRLGDGKSEGNVDPRKG